MLVVQDCIITDDIVDCRFGCQLHQCKGQCCVEGDCGAPLLENEVAELQSLLPQVEPFMTDAGRRAVKRHGVAMPDTDGNPCTTLVNNRECAFVFWNTDGTALCAIEAACRKGLTSYLKPVSCHLYPLRLEDFGRFISINYHRWQVCSCAAGRGEPLYIALREPLVRRFGQAWYDELLAEVANYQSRTGTNQTKH
ncbi:MAG: DUF3109 family protein [Bacteroidales bacterium]|nr:DUF3109 family protein [Bacteroidales bacterium]